MNYSSSSDSAYNAGRFNAMSWRPPSSRIDENEILKRYGTHENILTRCYSLVRNNWLARALLNVHLDFIVGSTGVRPVGGSKRSQEIFWEWANGVVDNTGTKSFFEIQQELVRGMFLGDVLAYLAFDEYAKEGKPTVLIQLIPPQNVRTPSEFSSSGKTDTGNPINLGVEKNSYGREIAYWVRKSNTIDKSDAKKNFTRLPRVDYNTGRTVCILVRNPDPAMIDQSRALSSLVPVINQIEDIATLEETGIEGAITKNLISAVYLTSQPSKFKAGLSQKDSDGNPLDIQNNNGTIATAGNLQSRSIQVIPGQGDLKTFSHSGSIDLVQHIKSSIHDACAGVDMCYELVMNDFTGVNFSGGKLSIDKAYRKIGRWVKSLSRYLEIIRNEVVTSGLEAQGLEIEPSDLYIQKWIAPPPPDPEPARNATARKTDLENGLVLRSIEAMNKYGIDWDEFLEISKAEKELEKEVLGQEIGFDHKEEEEVFKDDEENINP